LNFIIGQVLAMVCLLSQHVVEVQAPLLIYKSPVSGGNRASLPGSLMHNIVLKNKFSVQMKSERSK
jgi:hypothetical protein